MKKQKFTNPILEKMKIIARNYDEVVVYISILMSIIVQFVPDSFPWRNSFLLGTIYLGVTSLVFIVLDMKRIMEEKNQKILFRNMFDAKIEIFNQIEKQRKRKGAKEYLEIHIVGLKLRAISGVIHEMMNEIKNGKRVLYNTRIVIYYFDPKFFSQLISPTTPVSILPELKAQYNQFSVITSANVGELQSYNLDQFFMQKKIKLECYSYTSLPSFWGFGIDKEVVFLGPFTWNNKTYTLIGPQNPCIMIGKDDEANDIFSGFYYNRFDMFSSWK